MKPIGHLRDLLLVILSLCATTFSFSLRAEKLQVLPRSERTNLLVYLDAHGEMRPVKSKADWLKRRATILDAMQQVMGPLPGKSKRCPLDVQILEEVDCGSYVRRKLTYASEPGSRVPAYLLVPKSASKSSKAPAILCLHPTHMIFGNQPVVGLGTTNLPYGAELAERGYVVLAPAYPLMADYQPDLKALGYQSGTMKAIWDNMRGLDLLQSLPYVKRGGFGAIGHSLGGHNSIYTAMFDPRIQVIVSSCGFDSFRDYQHGNLQGWCSERYMPKLKNYRPEEVPFDFHELIGALAPRPCFINAPLRDSNFQYWSVDEVVRAAAPVYELYGVPGNLRVEHPDCEHDFPKEMREKAYRLLDENLR
ncbi:MAG TPA: dienelactone hydrolase family protein [Verrucomicrobiae bacterium]|nr:dienelactone hydrolase family protein [Verrucomicrobiae bacterium]